MRKTRNQKIVSLFLMSDLTISLREFHGVNLTTVRNFKTNFLKVFKRTHVFILVEKNPLFLINYGHWKFGNSLLKKILSKSNEKLDFGFESYIPSTKSFIDV